MSEPLSQKQKLLIYAMQQDWQGKARANAAVDGPIEKANEYEANATALRDALARLEYLESRYGHDPARPDPYDWALHGIM